MCGCHHIPAVQERISLTATIIEIPNNLFNFAGQAHLETYLIEFDEFVIDFDRYDDIAINGLRLVMEAIRLRADDFSFWQRTDKIGRPVYDERTVLIVFLVQQLLGLTFRETEGVLVMVRSYYRLEHVPDHSTLSRKLFSQRWTTVLKRFFQQFSPRCRSATRWWRRTPPAILGVKEDGGRRSTRSVLSRTGPRCMRRSRSMSSSRSRTR